MDMNNMIRKLIINKKIDKYIPIILLTLFVLVGLYFRLYGISTNHSFWSDEAFTSSLSKDLALGKRSFLDTISVIGYQNLHLLTVALSFKLFGFSEWAARIPYVIWGTLGIIASYFLALKLSNKYGAIISSFLYTVLELNLSYSTQARPYSALQTLLLFTILSLVYWYKNKKIKYILIASVLTLIAVLYHYLAILYFILLFPVYLELFIKYRKKIPIFVWIILVGIVTLSFASWGKTMLTHIGRILKNPISTNNSTFLRELFYKQFGFITIPSIFGGVILFTRKETKKIVISIFFWIIILLYLWTFAQTYHNMRYLLSFFALLCVLFGSFWGLVFKDLIKKYLYLLTIFLILLMFTGGNKIIRKPHIYYSPNMDLYGDVQIADYKNMFKYIKENYDYKNIVIFNDVVDAEDWYMDRYSNAYFNRDITTPQQHGFMKVKENSSYSYGTLKDFIKEKNKYKSGIVIVEDWHSFLPEDIKEYVKKNLKLVKRFEGLEVAEGDNWPLAIYSWGDI